jgi:hypothetical protein
MKLVLAQENPVTEKVYRFDIFKGQLTVDGRVSKVRSVGVADHIEGQATFRVQLKTFLKDEYYLLPESNVPTRYSILTRLPSTYPNKKYFWHKVGEGEVLADANSGLMQLRWDLLGASDIYLNLYPKAGHTEAKKEEEECKGAA